MIKFTKNEKEMVKNIVKVAIEIAEECDQNASDLKTVLHKLDANFPFRVELLLALLEDELDYFGASTIPSNDQHSKDLRALKEKVDGK